MEMVALFAVHVAGDCPDGWVESEKLGCLLKTDIMPRSMSQAEILCKKLGADLLQLNSSDDANAFLAMSSLQQNNGDSNASCTQFYGYVLRPGSTYLNETGNVPKDKCRYITFHKDTTDSCEANKETNEFTCDNTHGNLEAICQKKEDGSLLAIYWREFLEISMMVIFIFTLLTAALMIFLFCLVSKERRRHADYFVRMKALNDRFALNEYDEEYMVAVLGLIGADVDQWKTERQKEIEKADALTFVLKREHLPDIVTPNDQGKDQKSKMGLAAKSKEGVKTLSQKGSVEPAGNGNTQPSREALKSGKGNTLQSKEPTKSGKDSDKKDAQTAAPSMV